MYLQQQIRYKKCKEIKCCKKFISYFPNCNTFKKYFKQKNLQQPCTTTNFQNENKNTFKFSDVQTSKYTDTSFRCWERYHTRHTYVFTRAHVRVYTCTCVCVCVYTVMYTHMYVSTHVHISIYTCTCTCLHVYINVSIHVHVYTCTCTYIHVYMYVSSTLYICTCTCLHVYMYVATRVHARSAVA